MKAQIIVELHATNEFLEVYFNVPEGMGRQHAIAALEPLAQDYFNEMASLVCAWNDEEIKKEVIELLEECTGFEITISKQKPQRQIYTR